MASRGFLLYTLSSVCFLFLISFPEMITSRDTCPSIQCRNTGPEISYPFGIKDFQGVQCGHYPGFNVSCNSMGETVIDNLPFISGKFLVRKINYHRQEIQLQDPDNCLPRRYLQDQNDDNSASTSPLKAHAYQRYNFFSCASSSMATNINRYSAYFQTVTCLSSSTQTVLATVSTSNNILNINKILSDSGYCEVTNHISIPIPKPLYGTAYDLNKDDLYVSWDVTAPSRRDMQEADAPTVVPKSPTQEDGHGGNTGGVGVIIIIALLVVWCGARNTWLMIVSFAICVLQCATCCIPCCCCSVQFSWTDTRESSFMDI
ncbi:hypothetical protein MKW94_016577 [Papaver nudicaule]|uniref:RING-type E3 ubiquitin transferase n=1 Tax=Papaver nudicaule TaxID=74823 RepID=A0AA41VBX0_PAPNU|nr:hypothetical protein [Papaver nudicaule]